MRVAPIPENDDARVASLHRMNVLSTPRDPDLDRITRTAQRMFGTEIALVSLLDRNRQWFKARSGLDATETSRDISFCGHAIMGEDTFVVPDALTDERFFDNPLVTGAPEVRFYAGQPLTNADGYRIGTLCVVSTQPRQFSEDEQRSLEDLGRMVEIVLENHRLSESESALLASLAAADRDKLIDPLTGIWNRRGFDEMFERELARVLRADMPLSTAIVDIDHFKNINDSFGHMVGDKAIQLTASLLAEHSRATDVVARFGGEEFVIVAPGVEASALPVVGEKLLKVFRSRASIKTPDGSFPFTVSIGFSSTEPRAATGDVKTRLITAADTALYAAKAAGRDCCRIAGPADVAPPRNGAADAA